MNRRAPQSALFEQVASKFLNAPDSTESAAMAHRLGIAAGAGRIAIPFFERVYTLSASGTRDAAGRPATAAVGEVLCRYLLDCPPSNPPSGPWVSFRELKGAGPLTGHFTANTNKIVETTFAGRFDRLTASCRRMGARSLEPANGYDLCATFDFLPRIPIQLRFNDRDDHFPAQCSLLFRRCAGDYLDLALLSTGGTYLVGGLIEPQD